MYARRPTRPSAGPLREPRAGSAPGPRKPGSRAHERAGRAARGASGLAFLALFASALAPPTAAQSPVPRATVPLSTPGSQPAPALALGLDGDRVAALFRADAPGGGPALQVAVSDDAGLSFADPLVIDSDDSSGLDAPVPGSCVVVGDTIYAAWLDHRVAGSPGIHFTRSIDGGATFDADRRLSDGYPGTGTVTAWDLSVVPESGGDDVHVLFAARAPGATLAELFTLVSEDGGLTFEAPLLVYGGSAAGVDVRTVALEAEGDHVHTAWDETLTGPAAPRVWYRRSVDGGQSFLSPRQDLLPSDATGLRAAALADLAANDDRVGVLLEVEDLLTGANPELRIAVSDTGGAGFSSDLPVDTRFTEPRLGLDAAHLIVADTNAGRIEVARSLDGGATFTVTDLGAGLDVRLDTQDQRHVATWIDPNGTPRVLAAFSLDAGSSWSPPLVLTSGEDGVAALQGLVALEPGRGNVVAAAGELPPGSGAEALVALGFTTAGGVRADGRNAGANPPSLTVDLPVLGKIWSARVDAGSTGHALAGLFGAFDPTTLPLAGGQVLLADLTAPSGELLGLPVRAGPVALFGVPVPNDPRLAGLALTVQGVHLAGTPTFLLSNAFDLELAAF